MTDNEIIKALECCPQHIMCGHCPFRNVENCMSALYVDALDLINRQKAEIDELQRRNSELEIELKAMRGAANSYKAEIERFADIGKLYGEIRAEAIKEFAEKVNRELWDLPIMSDEDGEYDYVCTESLVDYIDNIVKEMVGE